MQTGRAWTGPILSSSGGQTTGIREKTDIDVKLQSAVLKQNENGKSNYAQLFIGF